MRDGAVLLGTFLPIIGLAATAGLAWVTRGATRWLILTALPAVTFGLCWLVIEPVWNDGNLLAAAIFMLYVVSMLVYYPVLLIVGLVTYARGARPSGSRVSGGALVVTLCGALLAADARAGQTQSGLPPPLQVEEVSRPVDGYDTPRGLGGPRVVVDLGTAENRPWPDPDDYGTMTVLGTAGSLTAHLEETFKTCETLCGNDLEECHYVSRLVPAGPLASIGTPVAALVGQHSLRDFVIVAETPGQIEFDETEVSSVFTRPVWPEENPADIRHRVRQSETGLVLDVAWGTNGGQTIPLGDCALHDRGALMRLACDGAEALVVDRVPILVSLHDYNTAGADVVATFVHDGQTYHVVRLALKAQTVYGFLFQDIDGWHARFRPRDYAQLC